LPLLGFLKSRVGNSTKVLIEANEKVDPQDPKSESNPRRIRDLCVIAQDVDLFDLQPRLLVKEQREARDEQVSPLCYETFANIIWGHVWGWRTYSTN